MPPPEITEVNTHLYGCLGTTVYAITYNKTEGKNPLALF